MGEKVRPTAYAGSWYPGEAATLSLALKEHFRNAVSPGSGEAVALVAPHAGIVYSGNAAASAYGTLNRARFDRIIVLAPTHRVGVYGAATCSYDAYATPMGNIPVHTDLMRSLESESHLFEQNDQAHAVEHSLELHLPFMQFAMRRAESGAAENGRGEKGGPITDDFSIIPLVIGSVPADEVVIIAETIRGIVDERTAIAVSSDFTHYGPDFGFVPFKGSEREKIELLDKGAIEAILAVSPERFRAYMKKERPTICGRTPIEIALYLLEGKTEGRLIDYYTSADVFGDRRNSVSYAAIAFYAG